MFQVADDPGSLTLRKEVSFGPRAGGGIVFDSGEGGGYTIAIVGKSCALHLRSGVARPIESLQMPSFVCRGNVYIDFA